MVGRLRFFAGIFLFLCVGCATASHRSDPLSPTMAAWRELREGRIDPAAAGFAAALARDPSDAGALFATANLAFEHGDPAAAFDRALTLIEAASRDRDELALFLSSATVSRVSRLLAELTDRRAAEERVIAVRPDHLPWQAQYLLALTVVDIARKRADQDLYKHAIARAGCAESMEMVGAWGRLPLLDLDGDSVVTIQPRPLVSVGCQFQLSDVDNRNGVRVLRSTLTLPAGHFDLVLDYAGPARIRLDGGAWRTHGASAAVYGPRASAARIDVAAGKHAVEIRIGSYGSTVDIGLLAIPAGNKVVPPAESDPAMLDLALALVANSTGDVDAMLDRIDRLAAESKFALGLAAAGRLGENDPTRPVDIMRERARDLWQKAVAVDPAMARVWLDLSKLELQNDRAREATEMAQRARQVAAGWWPGILAHSAALRAQGLEQPADTALGAAGLLARDGVGACELLAQAFQRAEARSKEQVAAALADRLAACDAQDPTPRLFAHKRGELDRELALLRRAQPTSSDPLWLRSEMADVLVAQGHLQAAADELALLSQLSPRDTRVRLRLADALGAASSSSSISSAAAARATLAQTLVRFPGRSDVRHAARLAGLALPLDDYRVDGEKVIRDYLASHPSYKAPAVVVLDRAVERAYADGSRLVLTHTITQVLSKDATESVGEVHVPEGSEILALRTRKADGSVREAEEIAGKSSISAVELAVGDFVESETLEWKEASAVYAPGFVGERFFFQSFEAPLDRSEYVLIAPVDLPLDIDRRADAPLPITTTAHDGTRVLTFAVRAKPQVFPEHSAVSATDWIPSVLVSSRIAPDAWSRFIAERGRGLSRGSPEVRKLAATIAAKAGNDRAHTHIAEAIVAWLRDNVEPENDFAAPATATLARHRGHRAWLMLALARELGVRADVVLARSLLKAEAERPVRTSEQDDFRELLVRLPSDGGDRFVDPQLRRAPFAYVLPAVDGAPAVIAGTSQRVTTTSVVKDGRSVLLRAQLEADGGARVAVTERLSGWPAVEWSELLDRAGKDRNRLRQDFEQNWLGHHFPGAQLDTLQVEPGTDSTGAQVSYTFKSARMAARQGGVLRLRPIFFQAQPGRRYGTEPQRKTTLMLGYDIPLDLDAEITLPRGAKVIDLGRSGDVSSGGARFVEDRQVDDAHGTISLRRQARLPLMRVPPSEYQGMAAKLRSVDPIEQGEIRISVPTK
jgi:hypothetical protein